MEVIGRAAELCVPRRAHLWSSSTPCSSSSSSSSSSSTTTTTPQVSSSFFASSIYVRKPQKTPPKTLKQNSRSSSSSSTRAKRILESDFLCPFLRSSCQSSIAGNGMSSAWSTLHQSYHKGHRGIVTMVKLYSLSLSLSLSLMISLSHDIPIEIKHLCRALHRRVSRHLNCPLVASVLSSLLLPEESFASRGRFANRKIHLNPRGDLKQISAVLENLVSSGFCEF